MRPPCRDELFYEAIGIATPGRLEDLSPPPAGRPVSKVKTLVLDEADRMLDMGFPAGHSPHRCGPAARAPDAVLLGDPGSFGRQPGQ